MTITEALAVNKLLDSLANVDGVSWDDMEKAGMLLADRAHKVLMSGHDGNRFRKALAKGQGQAMRKPRRKRRVPETVDTQGRTREIGNQEKGV